MAFFVFPERTSSALRKKGREETLFSTKNLYKSMGMRYIMFTILTDKETVEYGTDKKTEKS